MSSLCPPAKAHATPAIAILVHPAPKGDAGYQLLNDALRSLGLRRGQLQQAKVSDDQNRDLNQGFRGAIPLEYQERLRAYNQGVSRAEQADE